MSKNRELEKKPAQACVLCETAYTSCEALTMTMLDTVVREIEHIPEPLLREVLDFVRYLKAKMVQDRFDAAAASEPVLSKDWNRPEEDEAWRDL